MKYLIAVVAVIVAGFAIGSGGVAEATNKFAVCHNGNNPHTIHVSFQGALHHILHHEADYWGECREPEPEPTPEATPREPIVKACVNGESVRLELSEAEELGVDYSFDFSDRVCPRVVEQPQREPFDFRYGGCTVWTDGVPTNYIGIEVLAIIEAGGTTPCFSAPLLEPVEAPHILPPAAGDAGLADGR